MVNQCYFNYDVIIFYQGREEEEGEPESKKASLEETTEERHRLVHQTSKKQLLFV